MLCAVEEENEIMYNVYYIFVNILTYNFETLRGDWVYAFFFIGKGSV